MTVADDVTLSVAPDEAASLRRIVWSSVIGTAVEWYDFLIYGTATALVFNKVFFAAGNPTLATIAAFGTYAVGFLARPLGAAIFGHYGDRVGRKAMLAITIMVMGIGTFLIGLLPTYQQIGIAAPLLLIGLRFLQGIGLGGEWGGAVLMVVENCPTHRRGLLGSMVQVGNPIGNLAAIGMFGFVRMPAHPFFRVQKLGLGGFAAVLALIGVLLLAIPFAARGHEGTILAGFAAGLSAVYWFIAKVAVFMYLYIWYRATFPRYRFDQLMSVGWKVLLPIALAVLIATAAVGVLIPVIQVWFKGRAG